MQNKMEARREEISQATLEYMVDRCFEEQVQRKMESVIDGVMEKEFQEYIGQGTLDGDQPLNSMLLLLHQTIQKNQKHISSLTQAHSQEIASLNRHHEQQMSDLKTHLNLITCEKTQLKQQNTHYSKKVEEQNKLIIKMEKTNKNIEKRLSFSNQEIEKYMFELENAKRERQNDLSQILTLVWSTVRETFEIGISVRDNVLKWMEIGAWDTLEDLQKKQIIQNREEEKEAFITQLSEKKIQIIEVNAIQSPSKLFAQYNPSLEPILQSLQSNVNFPVKNMLSKYRKKVEQLESLKGRYSKFLEESEKKVKELKEKVKQIQAENIEIKEERDQMKEQMEDFSLKFQKNNELIYDLKNILNQNKILIADQESKLQQKSNILEKTSESLNCSFLQSQKLNLEIVSLKDALQTYKSIQSKEEEDQTALLMEQMVDKTYHIRFQNQELKEQNHSLLQEIEKLKKQNTEFENSLKQSNYLLQTEKVNYESLRVAFNQICTEKSKIYEIIPVLCEEKYLLQQQVQKLKEISINQPRQVGIKRNTSVPPSNKQNLTQEMNSSLMDTSSIEFQPNSQLHLEESIKSLNELVNYTLNYAKGYTRNGARNECWLSAQPVQYLKKATSHKNIQRKYENFERVRQICAVDEGSRQFVKDFEKVINFYLSKL